MALASWPGCSAPALPAGVKHEVEVAAVITVIIVKMKISVGLRPVPAARLRMSATIGAITCFEGPLMNTHSAWVAANWRPREDAPA
jgi:hypothetical protein